MDQIKRKYETTFIINASLEDAQIEAALTRASETITRNGGEIVAVNKWGRKRLAYPIQKKNNGFYINLEFTAPGAVIPQLERVFLLDENILRYLTIMLDKKALAARLLQSMQPPPPSATEPPPAVKEPIFGDDVKENGTEPAPAK
jgi:small subunit ribosomal protein S6